MSGIKIAKCNRGYYVKDNDPRGVVPGPEDGWLLQVTTAIEGAVVKFDNTVPMVVEDIRGRKLCVHFDNDQNLITSVEDLSDPGKQLIEFDIDEESGFWFITAGVQVE